MPRLPLHCTSTCAIFTTANLLNVTTRLTAQKIQVYLLKLIFNRPNMVSSNFCLSRHGYMKRESGCFSFTWKIIHGKKNSSRKRKFLNFLHILQMLESSILQMKTNLDALVLLNMRSTLKNISYAGPLEGLIFSRSKVHKQAFIVFTNWKLLRAVRGAANTTSGVWGNFWPLQHLRWLKMKLPTKLSYTCIKIDRITSRKIKYWKDLYQQNRS